MIDKHKEKIAIELQVLWIIIIIIILSQQNIRANTLLEYKRT